MKITLESTSKVVTFEVNGVSVPARIWEGHTANGVPVHCYITRLAAAKVDLTPEVEAQFAADLNEHAAPSEAMRAIPLRMIL